MHYYNALAEGYNKLYGEEQLNKLLVIKENIKVNKNAKILDVGCGTGISSNFGCFTVGVDISIELLKQNKNKIKLLSAAENLPFKDRAFDYVISVTALHNFKDMKKSLSEIKRVSSSNFVFSVFKKSKKFSFIENLIRKNFKIDKIIDEGKDVIFFCKKCD